MEKIDEIRYRLVSSPAGDLLLAATSKGLLAIRYVTEANQDIAFLSEYAMHVRESPLCTEWVWHQLQEYFTGERTSFSLPYDLTLMSPFQKRVMNIVGQIAYGEVRSYGEIAQSCDIPRGAQAVGGALAYNPLPIVIPCHRVLPRSRAVGGYIGGSATKHALLAREGVLLDLS